MAIRPQTLRLVRRLLVSVGKEADQSTRLLTQSWVRAWDELGPQWRAAMNDVIDLGIDTGQWPQPWQLQKLERLTRALGRTEETLLQLGKRAAVTIADGAGQIIATDVDYEPRLISSQLPAADQAVVQARAANSIVPQAIDVIIARTTGQINAVTWPLSAAATEAMKRELVTGIVLGTNPRDVTAARMIARVQGAFEGGLARAQNIARTEQLDAYRVTSRYSHAANADVVSGWIWLAHLGDKRTCPACWAMHGREYPIEAPGPLDHQQGRCARCPKTRTWRELGYNIDEPADTIPNAQKAFWSLPEGDQRAIMGPGRHDLLKSGKVDWSDLPMRRTSAGWRDSYGPRPVRDLQRIADRRAAAGIKPTPPAGATRPAVPKWHRNLDGDLDGIARTIATPVTASRQLGGGAFGDVRQVTYRGGETLVRKEYGSRAAGARTGGLKAQTDAEQLAPLVMHAVGARAPAVLRTGERELHMAHVDGKLGDEIVQWGETAPAHIADGDDGRLMGLADSLMMNTDRNAGNWIITGDGHTWGIDHGFAFDPAATLSILRSNSFATHFLSARGGWAKTNDMSPADMTAIRARLLALRPDFEHIGRGGWWTAMMGRMDKMASGASGTRSRLV